LPLLAKASAVLFGPLAMVLVELERLGRTASMAEAHDSRWRERVASWWRRTRRLRVDGLVVFSIGFPLAMLLCWTGGYGSFQTVLANMPMDNPVRPVFAWFANLPLFPNGLYAIFYQFMHNVEGHRTYLIGQEAANALWFYLPVMLTIKLPLATLLLVAASLAVPGSRGRWAMSLAGVLALLMLVTRIDIGIRLFLPLVAFMVIVAVYRVCRAASSTLTSSRRLAIGGLVVAVAWLAWSDLRVWPDAVRYTNELWGNTDRGYLYVSDSNYDWGQGLPELAEWQQQRAARVTVWYFGLDPRYPDLVRFDPSREDSADRVPSGGYFAVGTTLLYGGYTSSVRPLVMRLRAQTPVARTRTFLIFDGTDR
jgi:hypothetical protein